jgi:hypothetical protein
MLKSKSQWTCSYCSRIFKDPIELPCSHNLCRQHLAENNVIKENKIKCGECNAEFKVKGNDFKSNDFVKKQLEELVYLSGEEFEFKNKIQDSIRKFFEIYEEFCLNKTRIDLDVNNHFTEIRFKLDEHREELKEKVDDIYMEMIEKTKKFEAIYLKSLEDKLEASLKSFETKSLEQSLNETEESFRSPNVLIESIREMQRQQEEAIAILKCKLDEQSQVKDNLTRMNDFKPNVSFSQELFGQLYLNEYSRDPFESQILSGTQPLELIKLCEFSPKDKWSLLYRGSRDGFGAKDFHSKCDGHLNTLTIIKAKASGFIFGGFTTVSWESSAYGKYKSDANAFIFSLTNRDNQSLKMKIKTNKHQNAILCYSEYGPTFGNDMCIKNNANATMDSLSNLGFAYKKHPQYAYGTNEARTFLAGSQKFQLDEIEVYQKE